MPPQQKDSFVADSFTPDGETDSFVADSFKPEELQFENVEIRPGQWVSRKKGETEEQLVKRLSNREDRALYKAGSETNLGDQIRRQLSTDVANAKWIPEWAKPAVAAWTSFTWTEPAQLIADLLSNPQPEDILVPSIVKPSSILRTLRPAELPYTHTTPTKFNLLESKITPKEPPQAAVRMNLLEPQAKVGPRPKAVTKEYPPIMAQNPAENTILAKMLQEHENPELVLYPREEASGFRAYAEADEAFQADLKAQRDRENQRFARFMEPSLPGGEPHAPVANLGMDIRTRETPVGLWDEGTGTVKQDVKEGQTLINPWEPIATGKRVLTDEAASLPVGPDAQLYQTVPIRLWPRTAQTSVEALVPDRLKVPPHTQAAEGVPQIGIIPTSSEKPRVTNFGGKPGPSGGVLEPGGIATVRDTVYDEKLGKWIDPETWDKPRPLSAAQQLRPKIDKPRKVKKGRGKKKLTDDRQPKDPLDVRVVDHVAKNVEPAMPGAAQIAAEASAKNRSMMRVFADYLVVSAEKQLQKMGPIGQEIRRVLSGVEYTKRELFNRFAEPYLKAIDTVPEAERANLVNALDGTEQALTPAVAKAVEIIRKVTDDIATLAAQAGVRTKLPDGSIDVFKGLEHYWPHLPVNPIDQASFVDELMRRNPKLTRTKAEQIAQGFINESEFFHSPQHHRREGADFEYRKDLAAMTDHIAGMSDIIARAKHLGPGDIGMPGSLIDNLVNQTPDPIRAKELVRTHLRGGMDKNSEFYRALKKANVMATKFQVFTKLGLFPISNFNNQLQTMLHGNLVEFAKAFMQTVTGSPELQAMAREYGTVSVGNVPAGILAEAGKRPVPVVGGLVKWADDWARTVATGTGQGTAKALFQSAKNGSKTANRKLKNLLLEDDISDILKQPELSPDQLKFATQRFVELSQQLSSKMKLPPGWVNEPLLHIPLIFKQFAYQGTKSTWDAIMANPARNIPMFLLAAPMFGELTGDMKAAVYGAVRGAPMPEEVLNSIAFELRNRHRFAEKMTGLDTEESDMNWLVNRLTADYIQSWGLGLMGDMMQGIIGGPYAGYTAMAGPMIDDIVNGVTGTAKVTRDVLGGLENTSGIESFGRDVIRQTPVLGPPLQRRFLPTPSQEMPE